MFFDPTGIASFPIDLASIMPAFNSHLATTEAQSEPTSVEATDRLVVLITDLASRFGSTVDGRPWNTWPPIVSGGGHLVTLNIGFETDIANMAIEAAGFAQRHGVILIDPQGNQPVLSTPHRAGLLDM